MEHRNVAHQRSWGLAGLVLTLILGLIAAVPKLTLISHNIRDEHCISTLMADLRNARKEAIKRGESIEMHFEIGGTQYKFTTKEHQDQPFITRELPEGFTILSAYDLSYNKRGLVTDREGQRQHTTIKLNKRGEHFALVEIHKSGAIEVF